MVSHNAKQEFLSESLNYNIHMTTVLQGHSFTWPTFFYNGTVLNDLLFSQDWPFGVFRV